MTQSTRAWRNWFTPTHVGKIVPLLQSPVKAPVHPHARGENLRLHALGQLVFRFTPTHVGKMYCGILSGHYCRVHPHARGENEVAVVPIGRNERFTPTHVGKIM